MLKNHTQNVVEKLFLGPFLKNQNWAYLWINSLKFYTLYFTVHQVEGYRNILKLSCKLLAFNFTSYKVYLPHFLYDFWRKVFLLLYFINWLSFEVSFEGSQEGGLRKPNKCKQGEGKEAGVQIGNFAIT